MIIIRATIGDAELNLGIVEDDFDVEAWLESRAASLELLGVTDVRGVHYPQFVIPKARTQ